MENLKNTDTDYSQFKGGKGRSFFEDRNCLIINGGKGVSYIYRRAKNLPPPKMLKMDDLVIYEISHQKAIRNS